MKPSTNKEKMNILASHAHARALRLNECKDDNDVIAENSNFEVVKEDIYKKIIRSDNDGLKAR